MLIGRESERGVLSPLIAGARLGESGVLILTGDAGIGKTALLAWAAANVGEMQVLRATGIEAEREVPFGGLLQLLRPLLDLLDSLPGPQADALSAALAIRAGAAADRFAVGAGTLSLICRAAERRPIALFIDDAHLLDRPSADALAFAARRLLADAVLLLATVRTGEPCALIDCGLPEVHVDALDAAASAQLVASRSRSDLPAGLLDQLHRATGGNPLALLELSTDAENLLHRPPGAPVPVPSTVAAAVARETNRLDPAARTALLIAAASGGELLPVVRAIEQLGIDARALERAESAGLLTVSADRVLFRHPLVRSSVYGAADPEARRTAHRALFAVLPADDLDRRAWHLAESVVGPSEQAAALLERVADRAVSHSADAIAATAFERAARLSIDETSGIGRLVSAGESAWLAGQPDRARVLLAEALRRPGSVAQRVRTQEILGAIAARTGSLIDARDILSAASQEAEPFDPELAVTLLADAVSACFYLGDAAWGLSAIDRITGLLSTAATVRAQILGLMAVGTAQLLAGVGGMEPVRRSIELLSRTGELNDDPRRLVLLVLAPMLLRESGTGRDLINRAVEESRQRVAIGTLPRLLFHLARDEAATDRWAAASSEYHESIRLARETGQSTELAASLAGLGWLQARQGLHLECVAHLEESAKLCDEHQIHLFRAWCYSGLGDLAAGMGFVEPALAHFEAMATHLDRVGIHDVDLDPAPERVELLVRLGRPGAARDLAGQFLDRATAKGQPWAMARAERSMALCESDDAAADERLAAAVDWHDDTLDEYERAKTLLALGSHWRRSRRRAQARVPLRQALAIFDALGAHPAAAVAGGELRATGENPQPKGASMVGELTPQELQIATMLANGRTTRETAAALFLSPKTIEYHLRHVYTKLDVHSREALASMMNS